MDKFGRVYSLSVEVDSGKAAPIPYRIPQRTDLLGEDITISTNSVNTANLTIQLPYTVEFSIARSGTSVCQDARFRIYNLSEKTRKAIQKDQYRTDVLRAIQFRAGYYSPDTSSMPIIFNGQIKTAYSYRQGVDFITEIEAFDGGYSSLNSYTQMSVSPGQRDDETVKILCTQLKKTTAAALIGNFSGTNKRSEVLMGSTWDLIQKKTYGQAIIDNGQVKALNLNEYIAGDLPVIDSSTGLLGSPRRQDHILEVSMIFEPRFTVWQLLTLRSQTNKQYNGVYKVLGVRHEGVISAATCGECKTTLDLLFGLDNPTLVGGDYLR